MRTLELSEESRAKLTHLLARVKENTDRDGWIDMRTGERVWYDENNREIRRETPKEF